MHVSKLSCTAPREFPEPDYPAPEPWIPRKPMARILIAEDEAKTAKFMTQALEAAGFAVEVKADGPSAREAAITGAFDCAVFDIMLPGSDGLTVLREVRRRGLRLPVLLVTARGSVAEKVEGLDAGADDYLPKPFAVDELLARIRALLRRGTESAKDFLTVADLTLDVRKRMARRRGVEMELSNREFRLLHLLMQHPGEVQSREMILGKALDYHFDPGTNLVDVHMRRLRSKVDKPFDHKLLVTVPGVGYKIEAGS